MSDDATNNGPTQMEMDSEAVGGEVQSTAASSSSDAKLDSAFAEWTRRHLRNSPLSGNTEAWNHLMGALPKLKDYLKRELGL